MISMILPYCFDKVIQQSSCTVPVSQIIALWLWFRGALPSFQRRLCHTGTSVTWWTGTQWSELLPILCCWADLMVSLFTKRKIPHLGNWCDLRCWSVYYWWTSQPISIDVYWWQLSELMSVTDNIVILTSAYFYVFCKYLSDFANS